MKHIFRLLFLGIFFGLTYMGVEILWRGHTYVSMFILAGVVGILIGCINEVFTWDMPLTLQAFIGMIIATLGEFIAGCIINLALGLNQWSYVGEFGNILGQVCLPYMIAWYFLSIVCIVLDDLIRWKIFSEEKPHYKIF